MNIPFFIRNRRILKRYREILRVLTRNGFGFIADIIAKGGHIPFYSLKNHTYMPMGERLRVTLEELGPTFIKMGQLLSTRADLLPVEIIEELSKLQDDVPPESFDIAKNIIENELKGLISEKFIYFDTIPIASASIGQVYRAKTLKSEEVIVKVQRSDVVYKINSDIIILKGVAKLLNERISESPVDFEEVIEELSQSLLNELDYTQEAINAEKFKENFKDEKDIYIPSIYWEYTTKRVLTMEYVEGISVKDVDLLKEKGYDLNSIAKKGAWSIFLQIYKFGFFHGDPHPGNILIKENGQITYLDFGIVGFIDKTTKEMLIDLFKAFADNDVDEVVNILSDMGAIRASTNINKLKADLGLILSYFYNTPIKKINVKDSMKKIMIVVYKHKLVLPPDFSLLLKSLATYEGVGNALDPNFSISDIARDFIKEMYIHNFSITNFVKENYKDLNKIYREFRKLPDKIQSILNKLIKDDIKVRINIDESESMRYDLNIMINKIIISIIASALIVGSSLVLTSENGYKIFGYNAIGFFGFIIAGILCLWVFYRIFVIDRKKR
ncbi:MAG: 2-polyprenylphenol 6-hydroxylase [Thermoanaerobacteraceae bacterium]